MTEPTATNPAPTTPAPPRLLRVRDAMARLSLSRSVLYEQLRSGRLRSVSQGRTRLIPESAIADYIDLLRREANGRDLPT